jgi:dipeptidyl aminopeptidase/acylaminoacyl peptidase
VSPTGGDDRKAGEAGRAELERARDRAVDLQAISWLETPTKPGTFQLQLGASALPPVTNANGATAWLRPVDATAAEVLLPVMQLVMSKSPDRSRPIACAAPACTSFGFKRFWWSGDGKRVVFWLTDDGRNSHFYSWEPSTGAVKPILIANRLREDFRGCNLAAGDRLLCEREATTQPGHVASIDTRTGKIEVVADVNPEFRNIRLGRVEQVEWRLSKEVVDLGYPEMGNGNILYPPDFDPTRTYPLILAPYMAMAFARGDEGDEFPLHVYAANGFVVLNAQFPLGLAEFSRKTLREAEKASTSAGKGYPQWTAFLESTVRGLDTIEAKGFVDTARVGMGGLSAGAATTMYMLLKYDRLTAASTSGTGDTPALYYFQTRLGFTGSEKRGGGVYTRSSMARPDTEAGLKYWKDIDIAFHVDEVEAPILIHSPDREVFNVLQLIRHLDEAGKPYEIFVFPDERHNKWQPAHRYAIYNRNLDWFRFWLQDYEDPAPAKEEQYVRWRELRKLQCHNPRSLRDYCHVPAKPR